MTSRLASFEVPFSLMCAQTLYSRFYFIILRVSFARYVCTVWGCTCRTYIFFNINYRMVRLCEGKSNRYGNWKHDVRLTIIKCSVMKTVIFIIILTLLMLHSQIWLLLWCIQKKTKVISAAMEHQRTISIKKTSSNMKITQTCI